MLSARRPSLNRWISTRRMSDGLCRCGVAHPSGRVCAGVDLHDRDLVAFRDDVVERERVGLKAARTECWRVTSIPHSWSWSGKGLCST